MLDRQFFADSPDSLGIDLKKLEVLRTRVQREIKEGLLPSAQFAIARKGRIAWFETLGDAHDDTLYCVFSCTKAVMASAAWMLFATGDLDPMERVVDLVPEFGTNDKDGVRIAHLFLHTAGFPRAPFRPWEWDDWEARMRRFAKWRLNWPVESRFEYHPSSSMWVFAEVLERKTGMDFREFIQKKIFAPLGLSDDFYIGLPEAQNCRVAKIEWRGTGLTSEDYERMGIPEPPKTEVTEEAVLSFNQPNMRAIGIPGGGGICTAAALALFYQGLLHGGSIHRELVWSGESVRRGTEIMSGDHRDPLTGILVNRALGVVVAGEKDRNWRGFGHANSPNTFGHGGTGGQIGWADPVSGISFAYCTNGHDRNPLRQGSRTVSLSSKAASLSA